jgi:hypothetical protein
MYVIALRRPKRFPIFIAGFLSVTAGMRSEFISLPHSLLTHTQSSLIKAKAWSIGLVFLVFP